MKKYVAIFFLFASTILYSQSNKIFAQLNGMELAVALQEAYTPWEVLSYADARDTLYVVIDRERDSLYCGYTGYAHHLVPGTDPSQYIYDDGQATGMNCEHIWPQSKGTKMGMARSDMHHLMPVRATVNQARGNLPFGEVDDEAATHWYYGREHRREQPDVYHVDVYSELGQGRFEPPEHKKGDVARALFYVYVVYNEQIDVNFLANQLTTLRAWHAADPPDAREVTRSKLIGLYQSGKANPFVLDSTLVERIWGN